MNVGLWEHLLRFIRRWDRRAHTSAARYRLHRREIPNFPGKLRNAFRWAGDSSSTSQDILEIGFYKRKFLYHLSGKKSTFSSPFEGWRRRCSSRTGGSLHHWEGAAVAHPGPVSGPTELRRSADVLLERTGWIMVSDNEFYTFRRRRTVIILKDPRARVGNYTPHNSSN